MTETSRAVVPRPAASLLVVRREADGPAVLMGMRGAAHRFMPNRLVFPGGSVDAEDYGAAVASGLPEHVVRRLCKAGDLRLARALGVAAARELLEEAGLSLGTPPTLDALDYLCRAITPAASPIRFDARFFVVDAAHVSGTLGGDGELEELRFMPVAEALALDLATVTRGVLGRLEAWLGMTSEQRAAVEVVHTRDDRTWVEG